MTCSVEGCSKPTKRMGLCYGHYMKQWRYGTTHPTHAARHEDLAGQRFGTLVVTPERIEGAWICQCDCGRVIERGANELRRRDQHTCGDRATHYRTDGIAYCTAHDRVRQDRGRASLYRCTDCDRPAEQWSYMHDDPDELRGPVRDNQGTIAPYSLDPAHYAPRCISCHRRFDLSQGQVAASRR